MKNWFDFRSWHGLVALHAMVVLAFVVVSCSLWGRRDTGLLSTLAISSFGVFFALVYPAWVGVNARALRKHLHLLGYDWATWLVAIGLFVSVSERAWRLPTRDEAAAIPGYDDKVEKLVEIANTGQA